MPLTRVTRIFAKGLVGVTLFAFPLAQIIAQGVYGAFLGSKFKRVNSPKFEFTKDSNSSNT